LGSDARKKKYFTIAAAVAADAEAAYSGVVHDGGSDVDKTDVYLNGQLMMSGTSSSNGDYKVHGLTDTSYATFFFALEIDDVVTVITL
jgi:hypothetical protein